MPKTVAIIPARMDSSRLPGKGLRLIHGRELLWYLVKRLQSVRGLDEIVLATTTRERDTPLVDWASKGNIKCFRGACEDVLGRFHNAASAYQADLIIRANGDSPLLAPEIILSGLKQVRENDLDFATGKAKYTGLPPGLAPEFITMRALSKLNINSIDAKDREHITSQIFNIPHEYRWQALEADAAFKRSDISLVVDTNEDLAHFTNIVSRLPSTTNPAIWTVKQILHASLICGEAHQENRSL